MKKFLMLITASFLFVAPAAQAEDAVVPVPDAAAIDAAVEKAVDAAPSVAEKVDAAVEEVAAAATEVPAVDLKKGKKLLGKCKACHTFDKGGKNRVGPNQWGVYGRDIATVEGFKYSKAFIKKKGEIVWNDENLDDYLKSPKKFIKGNKMAFAGLKKEEDRAALIAYLKTLKD